MGKSYSIPSFTVRQDQACERLKESPRKPGVLASTAEMETLMLPSKVEWLASIESSVSAACDHREQKPVDS